MKILCKRALALLFALTLLLTLSASAFAEEPEEQPGEQQESETAPAPENEGEDPAEEPAENEPETPGEVMLYVSENGNDQTGDGSERAPFGSLARAAAAANEKADRPVYILLLTDLEMKESARFVGGQVTILAADKPVTVKRAEGFKTVKDPQGKAYNPAMIELRSPKGAEQKAGSLLLIGVILDDDLRHEGSVFEEAPKEKPEEAAAPAAADKSGDEKKPAGVQDAIISVGDEGSLTLGRGAELRNFGGLSAVHLGEKSQLTMEADSAICDTVTAANELPALLKAESAKVELMEGAKLRERGEDAQDEGETGEEGGEEAFSELSLTAPESLEQKSDAAPYEIPYTLRFALGDQAKELLAAHKDDLTDFSGVISLRLDPRMEADESQLQSEAVLDSGVFALESLSYDESSHTVSAQFRLKEGWQEQLDALGEPAAFNCTASLPADKFEPGSESEEKLLSSEAVVSLSLRYLQDEEEQSVTLESEGQTASTKMLGGELSTLVYDVNGGEEGSGPATEELAAQKAYPLKTEPAPSHADADGTPVLFLGWSAEPDETIYERITEDSDQGTPALIETVDIPTAGAVRVYAVYSKDINGDGIPDYLENLAILHFRANADDVDFVPAPIIHVVSTSGGEVGVPIPMQEPERLYFTFRGWGKSPNSGVDEDLYKYDADLPALRAYPLMKDTSLYAVWQLNYRINYDANGGTNAPNPTVVPSQTKTTDKEGKPTYTGRAKITPEVPTRAGYQFQGWATTPRGAAAFFAGNEVQITGGNVTLYAAWLRTGGGGGTVAPKTGDTNMSLYFGLLGLSALALAGTGVVLWRKRQKADGK